MASSPVQSRRGPTNGGMQAEWRSSVQVALDRANHQIDELSTQVSSIKAILDTYAQMAQSYAADRMSKATYEAEHKALVDRVTKLEGTGGRFIAWAGLAIAVLGFLLTLSEGALFGIVWLITHH